MSKFVLNCGVTGRPGGVRQQAANGRLPQRGRSLGRPRAGALEDPWFPKARRDTRRRLAGIQAALLSQLLTRLVPGGQPAGEQQLSLAGAVRPLARSPRRPRAAQVPLPIAPRPPATIARSARSCPLSDRRGVPASWPARPGPPDHRAYAVAASRSANLAGCAMCGKCPLSAQTSTVACGAAFSNQAAVSGDGSEPRISR